MSLQIKSSLYDFTLFRIFFRFLLKVEISPHIDVSYTGYVLNKHQVTFCTHAGWHHFPSRAKMATGMYTINLKIFSWFKTDPDLNRISFTMDSYQGQVITSFGADLAPNRCQAIT